MGVFIGNFCILHVNQLWFEEYGDDWSGGLFI